MNGIVQRVALCTQLLSLGVMFLGFVHVIVGSSFVLIAEHSIVWVCHSLSTHSPADGHLDC